MVAFKDLHSDNGLKALNNHLATRSYIEGYQASGADVALLTQIAASIDRTKYPHVARWLAHITSFPLGIRAKWASSSEGGKAKKKSAEDENEEAEETTEKATENGEDEEDDDFMTSLSDDEDGDNAAQELIAKKNAEREAAKKGEKKGPIARSSLILDIKPEDSDTNMDELLNKVKEIAMEGLQWGGHEFVPVAYGIRKLRIIAVVVDDLVSTDDLQEQIEGLEGVQSTDIHAFNKL